MIVEHQVWRDMARDMVSRDRQLRITSIEGQRATCVVIHDTRGTVGKEVKIAVSRFETAAFQLVEDVTDDADQELFDQLLVAMANVHRSNASPAEYARAAMNVVRANSR